MFEKGDLKKEDFNIESLGKRIYLSPLDNINFVDDTKRILYDVEYDVVKNDLEEDDLILLERAGPRERLFYDPKNVVAGIVTCGGLCPGLNNVIRSLVVQLSFQYKVSDVIGIRHGFQGLHIDQKINPIRLDYDEISNIHGMGGSFLGSSRGFSDPVKIVDGLEYYGINMFFTIGGDGTAKAGLKIKDEITRRNLDITVINIPKTIDNDIPFISKSFGFETAFSEAVSAIRCAHVEARGAPNGIGIVKVMGRDSGFIAAQASLAQKDANFVLVPELDFDLEGSNGLFKYLEDRLNERGHALIVVAEGAGQKFFDNDKSRYDMSGNKKLEDIGQFLKRKIKEHFANQDILTNVKYIDPSYIIRSVPANANDSVFCGFLAENAVHAAMAGKTGLIIAKWNDVFVHLPMEIVKAPRKKIDPKGSLWRSIKLSTGQKSMKNV